MSRLIPSLLIAGVLALPATADAQQASSAPTCIYESHAYSEGADVCVARSLMQTCTSEAGRLIWKTVTDPDISRLCAGRERSRWSGFRHRVTHHAPRRAAPASAKCFHFNGKTYCE
jgi:hypothetical protein